jgi:hypothetical protein
VDLSKAAVLSGIARLLDLCADVPVECIMFLLVGHCGAHDVVTANDDPSWTVRDKTFDVITPKEAFDVARKERVRHRIDATIKITCYMLAIVAAGHADVHKRMLDRMLACSSQKRARVDKVLNGDTDGEDAMQSVTHQSDAEGSWEHETSYQNDSDDCGM